MRIIRGKYGRRRFDVPKNITARPTTDFARENLFNVLENRGEIEDMKVLDLFAGTGAISWEFVSRGARSVTAVEEASVQARFILSVKEKLGDTALRLVRGDAFKFLAKAGRPHRPLAEGSLHSTGGPLAEGSLHLTGGPLAEGLLHPTGEAYDVVFADPPYQHPRFAEIPGLIMGSGVVKPGTLVIVEHSGTHDFSGLPGFMEKRSYGSVNFSMFRISEQSSETL